MIFGGEDHKTGQVTGHAGLLRARSKSALGACCPRSSVTHRWSGQVIETPDGLPYLGRMGEHHYAATGFAGNGMTFGTLGAMMCADAILGRANPWAELFAPDRKALGRGLWEYVKENKDYPYYLVRDRFAGAEGRSWRRCSGDRARSSTTRAGRRVSRRGRRSVAALGDLHAHGLPRRLEPRRADLGLSVPRLAVQPRGR